MRRRDEISDPNSCLNRAGDDEMIFVLLSRDVTAPCRIRDWAVARVDAGKNCEHDPQITEAFACADTMECEGAMHKPTEAQLEARRAGGEGQGAAGKIAERIRLRAQVLLYDVGIGQHHYDDLWGIAADLDALAAPPGDADPATLRQALEPFAKAGAMFDERLASLTSADIDLGGGVIVSTDDFRRAHAALSATAAPTSLSDEADAAMLPAMRKLYGEEWTARILGMPLHAEVNTVNPVNARAAFEAWVTAPPYEFDITRIGGSYEEMAVQLAWEAWQQAAPATPLDSELTIGPSRLRAFFAAGLAALAGTGTTATAGEQG